MSCARWLQKPSRCIWNNEMQKVYRGTAPPLFPTSALRGPPAPRPLLCLSLVLHTASKRPVQLHFLHCIASQMIVGESRPAVSTTKTFDFPCACTPFVTDLSTYTTVQINTGLTTSSFDWMGLFFRFFHRKSMSSSDSLVTSHGVHDKHLVLIIWSRICSCMAAASPNGKVWPLSQFSYKLFDGFVSQLICFTKMKPSIRNIRLLFELLIQGCFCFLIYLFGQREISILNV